jgi:glutaredoxin
MPNQKKIEIYSKPYCIYCDKAKFLLESLNLPYQEYDVLVDETKYEELMSRATIKIKTLPQIFINDVLVGGYDDLNALLTQN